MGTPYTLQATSGAETELRRTIYPDEPTIAVISHNSLAPAGRVRIGEAELVTYTGKAKGVVGEPVLTGCTRGADRAQGGSAARQWPGGTRVQQVPYEKPELVGAIPAATIDQVGRQVYLEAREPELSFYATTEDGSAQRDLTTPDAWPAAYLSNFGGVGLTDGLFGDGTLRGIAVDSAGNVYITSDSRIQKLSANGTWIATLATVGTATGKVDTPGGLAVNGSNLLYVADTGNSRVQSMTLTGTSPAVVSISVVTEDQPFGLVLWKATGAELYISDMGLDGVVSAGIEGAPGWGYIGAVKQAGEYINPMGLASIFPLILVVDSGNHRVAVSDSDGDFRFQFGSLGSSKGQFNTPHSIALDSQGNIYVTDSGNHRVQVFDKNGIFQGSFGSFGAGDGQLDTPTGIAITDDYIYVCDSGNNRVCIFGNPVARSRQSLLVPFWTPMPGYTFPAWVNMPAAVTELFGAGGATRWQQADLSGMSEARVTLTVSVAGSASAVWRAQYSTNGGGSFSDLGASAQVEVSIAATGKIAGSWAPIAAAAQADVILRLVGASGNSTADPVIVAVDIQCR